MRSESQKTWISTLRDHVNEWRKREGWSRETVAQAIVEQFEQMGGPEATGIYFEPKTRDTFERQKVNADRIFRWLDDVSKDGNLMPANFSRYVLAAMPIELRMACMHEEMAKIGLSVSVVDDQPNSVLTLEEICEANIAVAETVRALTIAQQNPTPENLDRADITAANATGKITRIRKKIAGSRMVAGAKAIIGKIVNRKEKVSQ